MSGINKASPSFSSSSSLLVVKPLPAAVPPLLELVIVVVVGAAVVAVVPLFVVLLLPLFLLDLQMSQSRKYNQQNKKQRHLYTILQVSNQLICRVT